MPNVSQNPVSVHVHSVWRGGYSLTWFWSIYCGSSCVISSRVGYSSPERARASAIKQFDTIVNFFTICRPQVNDNQITNIVMGLGE